MAIQNLLSDETEESQQQIVQLPVFRFGRVPEKEWIDIERNVFVEFRDRKADIVLRERETKNIN